MSSSVEGALSSISQWDTQVQVWIRKLENQPSISGKSEHLGTIYIKAMGFKDQRLDGLHQDLKKKKKRKEPAEILYFSIQVFTNWRSQSLLIYEAFGYSLSATNCHLHECLPSTRTKSCAIAAADLQHPLKEFRESRNEAVCAPGNCRTGLRMVRYSQELILGAQFSW